MDGRAGLEYVVSTHQHVILIVYTLIVYILLSFKSSMLKFIIIIFFHA